MSLTDAEVLAFAERIRERARAFMAEAAETAEDCRNVAKLTSMASSLNWAARELCLCADVDLTRRPDPQPDLDSAAIGRRRLYRLAHLDSDRMCVQVGRARACFRSRRGCGQGIQSDPAGCSHAGLHSCGGVRGS